MINQLILSEIAKEYGGTIVGPDCVFQSVSTDSRKLHEGQLFVALKGEKFDGHKFIPSISKKVCGLVVEHPLPNLKVSQWIVPDTTKALGQIARANRKNFNGYLIGITGSCGKTSVKEMIAFILAKIGPVLFTKDNFNNEIGVPSTLINISASHNYAVVEMGAKAIGDIDYLCTLAAPDIGLVNNILPTHLESFGSLKNIAKAKGEIYSDLPAGGSAVVNLDEPYAAKWCESTNAKIVSFSIDKSQADFTVNNLILRESGYYSFNLVTPEGKAAINLPLSGKHSVMNAIAAAACAYAAGAKLATITDGLNHLKQIDGRMKFEKFSSGLTLIDDTYNASPGSVKAAIDSLIEIDGLHVLVLGDMAELGRDEIQFHADIGKYALDAGVNVLLAIGPLCSYTVKKFGEKGQHFNSKKELVSFLANSKLLNSSLNDKHKNFLIKGSRFTGMEDVSQFIRNWETHKC